MQGALVSAGHWLSAGTGGPWGTLGSPHSAVLVFSCCWSAHAGPPAGLGFPLRGDNLGTVILSQAAVTGAAETVPLTPPRLRRKPPPRPWPTAAAPRYKRPCFFTF